MPFMKGKEPIRRSIKYLNAGNLVLKDRIKIFSVNYNTHGEHHSGARNFVFWNLPQVQYKNPNVQVISFRNMTPSPFIRCYFDSGKQMLIDIDSRSNDEILSHLIKVIGKSKEILLAEEKLAEKKENPANVGVGCERQCICELPGQVPCPAIVPLPFSMRGKYKYQQQ